MEGCYIHFDQVEHIYVRSGKACGSDRSEPRCDFKNRNDAHEKKAQHAHPDGERASDLYVLYPSRCNINKSNILRRGHFEDLIQYVGLGFDRDVQTNALTDHVDGLFLWKPEVLTKTDRMNVSSCNSLRERQLVLVSYLFEMIYDISISQVTNVNCNLGFESCLGIYSSD